MGSSDTASLRGAKILVVDDDPDSLILLEFVLTSYGVEVSTATDVETAKAIFTEARPQLVISDIAMPKADGISFIQWIRSLSSEAGEQVPAVAVTAKVFEADKQEVLQAGFDQHLRKPIEIDTLLNTVVTLLQTSQTAKKKGLDVGS